MPDITMCKSDECPWTTSCYRHPDSGTQPSEYRQAWFLASPGDFEEVDFGDYTEFVFRCSYFWRIKGA